MSDLFEIVHEDDTLLVINKASGLVCHPSKNGPHSSLIGRVRLYLGDRADAHMINRLDRETSGLIVVAKSREAAAEARKIWERRMVQKTYHAVVHGRVQANYALISLPLGKDEASVLAIKDCVRPDGASAQTEFWVKKRFLRGANRFTLLEVVPFTGRKHQIRIHLAHHGHPIVGDKMYGDDEDAYLAFVQSRLTEEQAARLMLPCHALHASRLDFSWRGRDRSFQAKPENWFVEFHSRSERSSECYDSQPANN